MPEPIVVARNPEWVDPATRLACKYSPVVVAKVQTDGAIGTMQAALRNRIQICQRLAGQERDRWFSFRRAGPFHEPHLRSSNVPVIVISGGSAKKLAQDLGTDYSLAWHPINLRNEPLYLLVHKLDFNNYAEAMSGLMSRYRNMHLIGWDGRSMTGFGAARAAALAFADTLPYRPKRILMMDQDVIQTEATRHTRPAVHKQVQSLHRQSGVVGLGVGYPTRVEVPKPFEQTPAPSPGDFNSPAQQFVSIQAPFRERKPGADGIYPVYMVAGGEDMLMGMELGLIKDDRNTSLLGDRILKKGLQGPADTSNDYWNKARPRTLQELFNSEKETPLVFEGKPMSMDGLMSHFVVEKWLKEHPNSESHNVSACVIERIILRLHKLGKFPAEIDGTVFNRV